jgi:hypothetical protein
MYDCYLLRQITYGHHVPVSPDSLVPGGPVPVLRVAFEWIKYDQERNRSMSI